MKRALVTLLILTLAVASFAQGFGGGQGSPFGQMGGPISMLLMDPKVIQELGLSADQAAKLVDLGKGMGDDMQKLFQTAGTEPDKIQQAMKAYFEQSGKKQLAILTADQYKRLREIYVQDNGVSAVANADVQADLGLSKDQVTKISALQDGLGKATQTLTQKLGTQEIDIQQFQSTMKSNQDILKVELGKVLTDDQKKKLKSLEGKPFKRTSSGGGGGNA